MYYTKKGIIASIEVTMFLQRQSSVSSFVQVLKQYASDAKTLGVIWRGVCMFLDDTDKMTKSMQAENTELSIVTRQELKKPRPSSERYLKYPNYAVMLELKGYDPRSHPQIVF